jgi:prepilin-type processing-associated H-X9-DG protein
VLNGYLAEIKDEHDEEEHGEHEEEHEDEHEHEHEHEGHDHEHFDGRFASISKLKSTSTTIVLFEAAVEAHVDHVDAFEWFVDERIVAGTVYDAITAEVAVDRHAGGQANYLFADNHIEVISAEQIRQRSLEGTDHENFVLPRD